MGKSIVVGPALLTFESIKKPKKGKNDDGTDKAAKWEATIAFPPGSPIHQTLIPLEQEAKFEKFGPQHSGAYRSPFRDDTARDQYDQSVGIGIKQDPQTFQNYYDPNTPDGWRTKCPFLIGMIAINLKSNDPIRPFHSVGGKSVPMTDEQMRTMFYPGIQVYVDINAWAYGQKGQTPGVSFGLNGIFFHAHGTPLVAVKDSSRAFGEIAQNPVYAQNPAAANMFPNQQQQNPLTTQAYQNYPAQGITPLSPPLPNGYAPTAQQPPVTPAPAQYAPAGGLTAPVPAATPNPMADPAYLAWLQAEEAKRLAAAGQQTRGF